MFQFRAFPSYDYFIHRTILEYCSSVFPHSDISGSSLICSSPKLFAACHVLHRLLMPRHSPYALIRLNFPISDVLPSLGSLRSLELLEFHKTFFRLFLLFAVKRLSFCALIFLFPPIGEIVFYPTFTERPILIS